MYIASNKTLRQADIFLRSLLKMGYKSKLLLNVFLKNNKSIECCKYYNLNLFLLFFRPFFTEVQLLNPSRALMSVLPLSPENSQNNLSSAPHPADIHPAYRIPYMQLLHSLHNATSPQSSLHATGFSAENIARPAALNVPFPSNSFSNANNDFNVERMQTDRSESNTQSNAAMSFSRKRALSSSPYPDVLDVGAMIRCSPNSLYGSKNSMASGSFGHLSATALSNSALPNGNTNGSIGTPMSISSLQTSLQHFLMSGDILPSLSGHYISPTNSMFSLAHHQAMASSLMQVDASMQSLKSVRSFSSL